MFVLSHKVPLLKTSCIYTSFLFRLFVLSVVQTRATQPYQLTLTTHANLCVWRLCHSSFLLNRGQQFFQSLQLHLEPSYLLIKFWFLTLLLSPISGRVLTEYCCPLFKQLPLPVAHKGRMYSLSLSIWFIVFSPLAASGATWNLNCVLWFFRLLPITLTVSHLSH